MKNLSQDIEASIKNSLEGMMRNVDVLGVADEKLSTLVQSRYDSFSAIKEMIALWQNSPNSPSDEKLTKYVKQLIKAGDNSVEVLRQALRKSIDFEELDAEQYGKAIKAKPILFRAIQEIDSGLISLRYQLESGNVDFKEREFKPGFPERYAKGEFFPTKNYYKEWHNEEEDAIILDPKGTKGEIIVLDGLKIQLPEIPKDKKKILFWDLPKEEQYWRRPEPPKGISPETEDAWTEYILEEFRRRREGIHFYNNGNVVYLVGAHYMGLTHNKMLDTGGYKEFRWAQCQLYYFIKACIVDNRSLGIDFVKGRRSGFTEAALDFTIDDSTSMINALLGMTSKTGEDVEKMFSKYLYTLQNLPFFFIPVVKGKIDDKNKIEFAKVSDASKAAKKKKDTQTDDYLNTKVDWQSSTTLAYDSTKLVRYICDEAGKRERPQNILDHWDNIRPTMLQGGAVVGKCFMGSTLNPYNKGGKEFQTMYYGSNVKNRDLNGMTTTGLYSFFLPAHKNMEAFTDKYGICHEVLAEGDFFYNSQGKKMTQGALQYLENSFKAARAMGAKTLNNRRRLDPITIEDAFRDESKGSLFNLEKINDQISYNNRVDIDKTLARGNFQWKDNVKDSEVVWMPNERGRFLLAWIPPKEMQNRWVMKNNQYGGRSRAPLNDDLGCIGIDSYDISAVQDSHLEQTENGSEYNLGSKGAISGLTAFTMKDMPSNFFFLFYCTRPQSAEIFFEDALMACVFYGFPALVENNKSRLLYHFLNRGYRNYCLSRFDKPSNRLSPTEKMLGGIPSNSVDVITTHASAIEDYVEKYVGIYNQGEEPFPIREENEIGSCPFNLMLKDWAGFNIADRTKYDITIASGYAIMGVNRKSYKMEMPQNKPLEFSIRTYK